MKHKVSLLLAVCVVGAPANAGLFSDLLTNLGEAIARPVGGVLRGVTGPTIEKARSEVGVAVADLDSKVAARVDQVGVVAHNTVEDINVLAKSRLEQGDEILAARIAQVHGAGTDLVKVAAANVQQTVHVVDDAAKHRINQASEEVNKTITHLDNVVDARFAQVDTIAKDVIREADEKVAARLDQADEIAGRRLGNVDTIVSKQLIGVESMAVKIVSLIGLVVMLLYTLLRSFREWSDSLGDRSVWKTLGRLGLRMGVSFVLAGAFFWLAQELPGGSALKARQLRVTHEQGFTASVAELDLTSARFHVSQLLFLGDTETPFDAFGKTVCPLVNALRIETRTCLKDDVKPMSVAQANAELDRVTLLRDVLSKPASLATADGRTQALARARQLDPASEDAQFNALRAVIRYHGATDAMELPALVPALQAGCHGVKAAPGAPRLSKALQQVSCETLEAVRLALPSNAWLALVSVPEVVFEEAAAESPRKATVDALALFLTESAARHADFLDAQVQLCQAAGAGVKPTKQAPLASVLAACEVARVDGAKTSAETARASRAQAAKALQRAWLVLLSSPLEGPASRARLLLLDDAALSLALASQSAPTNVPLPLASRAMEERLSSLPPRVALAAEAFSGMPAQTQTVAGLVEASRFMAYQSLEEVVLAERLRRGARTTMETARFVAALEVKGLLGQAIERQWVSASAAREALALAGATSLPLRRLLP